MNSNKILKLSAPNTINAISVPQSLCIAAPAGSGKTYCLIARLLYLLSLVNHPSKISVITFTKKATLEIQERVENLLLTAYKSIDLNLPCSTEPLNLLAIDAAKNLIKIGFSFNNLKQQLKISTIDSFFLTLYKKSKDIEVIHDAEIFYSNAVSYALTETANDKLLLKSLSSFIYDNHFDLSYIKKELIALLKNRNIWIHDILRENHNQEAIAALKREICSRIDDFLTIHLIDLSHSLKFNDLDLNNDKLVDIRILTYQNLFRALLTKTEYAPRKRYETNNFFNKTQFSQYIDVITRHHESIKETLEILDLIYDDDSDITPFINLLKRSYAHLKVLFDEQGIADYSEVESLTLSILLNDYSDFTETFINECDHLLVDEYQDVSLSQHKVFESLTSEWSQYNNKSIFFVGDPLQSIYGFRNPHISIYPNIFTNGFNDLNIVYYELSENFRSKSHIVEWVNNYVGDTIASSTNALVKTIPFIDSVSNMRPNKNPVYVSINNDTNSSLGDLIHYIKNKLTKLDGTVILVKNKKHADFVAQSLFDNDIELRNPFIMNPYVTIEHLIALAEFYLSPRDDDALIKIFKAPWLGLSWTSIQEINQITLEESLYDNMLHLLSSNAVDGIIEEEKVGVLRTIKYLSELTPSMSLSDWIFHAWVKLKGNIIFNKKIDHKSVQLVINVFNNTNINTLKSIITNDKFYQCISQAHSSVHDQSGITISTIHASKGMEYDNVVLFNVANESRAHSSIMRYCHFELNNGNNYFLASVSSKKSKSNTKELIAKINKLNDYFERLRLLYVGTTRAKENLAIIGNYKDKIHSSSLIRPLIDFHPELIDSMPNHKALITNNEISVYYNQRLFFSDDRATSQVTDEALNIKDPVALIEYEWAREDSIIIGVVIHELINMIAHRDIYNDKDKVSSLINSYGLNQLKMLGISSNNLDYAYKRISYGISTILSSKIGAWILSEHIFASNEHTVISSYGQTLRIDRLFIDKGALWIVDYKSSYHDGGNLSGFIDNEVERYKIQLNNYGKVLSKGSSLPINLCIYFTMHDEFRSWSYE
jgi:ATP-dependent helicase/nuclease subunit A